MKAVIMAGGRGKRLGELSDSLPKPLVKIQGMPILEREIYCLREQGIKDIVLTIGYLGEAIRSYFGDGSKVSPVTGESFGVNIEYYFEETPLGNAGALFKIKDSLSDDFFLLNADSMFDVDLLSLAHYHKEKGGLATLLTHPNNHPYDSAIIIADSKGTVQDWLSPDDERPDWYKNRVNAGIHILNKSLLEQGLHKEKIDLDRDLLKPLAGTGRLFCYDSTEYVKDMGTVERLTQVSDDIRTGMDKKRSLRNRQRAVFLDRDGVLNKYVGYVRREEELELLPGAAEAVRRINKSGYLAILVTNQPVVARGEVSFEKLEIIHNKLETLLGRGGAFLDAIYVCPHHPDKGFPGEIASLKVDCECRKPKPGLLMQAAKRFNIDLAASWMVGDSERDIEAGKRAGTKTALINGFEYDVMYGQNETYKTLFDFVAQKNW